MSIPPPPPPEPPKMEIKAEPAAKPIKPTPKEEPKAAAKEPESSKGKSAKDTLSRFFRPKVNEQQTGDCKISILRDDYSCSLSVSACSTVCQIIT